MTRRTNAAAAGVAYLLYIAVAFPKSGIEARVQTLFDFISCVCAIVLAVTLYALTREEDRDLALLGFSFRLAEGASTATAIITRTSSFNTGGSLFAIGSTFFCYLLLRGRIIPAWLAWIGFAGSLLVAIGGPIQLAGFIGGKATNFMWLPVGVFEILVAFYFILKGASPPRTRQLETA